MPATDLCICEFHRPNARLPTFSELAAALIGAINASGHVTRYLQGACDPRSTNLVFGAHRLFENESAALSLPASSVIFNLENLSVHAPSEGHARYRKLLQSHRVIDYSQRNIHLLEQWGNRNTHRFRFGYTTLPSFICPPRSEHLLFFGSLSDRRKGILHDLISRGQKVKGLVNQWGFQRDYEILTSKGILNISKTADSQLEVYRLWHALCLGTAVVSERGSDTDLAAEWAPYVTFVDDLTRLSSVDALELAPAQVFREATSFDEEVARLLAWLGYQPGSITGRA